MPTDAPPLVDVGEIIRLVGQSSFQRARGYARGGAVESFDWDPAEGILVSTVQGNAAQPYRPRITLRSLKDGYYRPTSSTCTCPVAANCKHVAATLLDSNAAHMRQAERGELQRGSDLGPSVRGSTKAPTFTPTAEATWKTTMSALTAEKAPSTARPFGRGVGETSSTVSTPLGLQFELREQTPRSNERWRGPTAKAATAVREPGATYRLGVRPVIPGTSGNWVRTNVTWNSITHQMNRLALDPAQHRWFTEFAALYRATTRDVYTGQDPDWIYLDDFHSPLLWPLLADATRLGIELVGNKKDAVISIGKRAVVSLDASSRGGASASALELSGESPDSESSINDNDVARDRAADLWLTTRLAIDGELYRQESAGAIGSHGVYSVELAPSARYTLAPSVDFLSDEQRRLLKQDPATLVVPANDVTEFLTEFYPRLRRSVAVSSHDDSVDFPEIIPPLLVLTAQFRAKHVLRLSWDWEYQEAGGPVRRALRSTGSDSGDRDLVLEEAAIDNVEALLRTVDGSTDHTAALQSTLTLQGLDAAEFTDKVLPLIAELDGIRVDVLGDKPDYQELTEAPQLTIKTVETDQRDWFDLGVIVTIEGRDVPFGPLFKALSKGQKKLLLVDNSYLSLDHPAFDELQRLIGEASALQEWETGPRISRYQASLWADFEDLADETEQAGAWRTAVAGLLELSSLDLASVETTPLPSSVQATMRPYQQDGFNWLAFLWKHQLGGVLADDMGLGKTLQTLALISHAVEAAPATERLPFLVVAPTSVVSNWLAEAQRFAPHLTVRGITATQTKSGKNLAADVSSADIIVTSYALFRLDFEAYQDQSWAGLILDEAQFVKNHSSKAHEAAKELAAPFKLAITGTPMENSLTDLWSLFSIVAPGLFPSARKFAEEYVRPIARGDNAELMAKLRRRIRPLMMRRTKEIVAQDLPAKQEQELRIDLNPRHKTLYDTYLQRERQKLLGLIGDMDKNRFVVFRSLTLLRMLSLDASLVDEGYSDIPSSKLDALFDQLGDVIAEGHRALIFSQFTSFLQKAAHRLDEQNIEYAYLDGSTLRRAEVIEKFKSGTAPVFLISLKAGGFGLNLTEADYVFLLDPWWNPASEAQAVDRTHRIGQTKNVMVYRMVAKGTIEEKVMAL
ncbi:MAG TPA: SNF2-related protein, partial [Glaciihabitans sp.]|nr:SNF2-related protein [Glaciihabitans sp.]